MAVSYQNMSNKEVKHLFLYVAILTIYIVFRGRDNGPGAGEPCVFPFKFLEVTANGCIEYYDDDQVCPN